MYWEFHKARDFVHKLELENVAEWKEYCNSGKKPEEIPSYPNETKAYAKFWKGMPDWLGTAAMDFQDARKYARNLGFTSPGEWRSFVNSGKKPRNIPKFPETSSYAKNDWKGYPDFLGYDKFDFSKLTNSEKKANYEKYLEFAKKFYNENNCTSREIFLKKTRLKGIPKEFTLSPLVRYREFGFGWELITGNKKHGHFAKLSDDELKTIYEKYEIWAREIYRKNNLTGNKSFIKFIKTINIPEEFPRSPVKVFKRIGFTWIKCLELDSNRRGIPKNYLSYEKSKPVIQKFVKEKNLKTLVDYNRFKNEPDFPSDLLPRDPFTYYGDDFEGINIWMGTGKQSQKIPNYDFVTAKTIYQQYGKKLKFNLSETPSDDWTRFTKSNEIDSRLFKIPWGFYGITAVKKRLKGIKSAKELQPGIDYYYDIYDTFGIEDPNWSSNKIKEFLHSLLKDDYLLNEDSSVLFSLLDKKGLFDAHSKFSSLIKLIPSLSKNQEFTEHIKKVLEKKRGEIIPDVTKFELERTNIDPDEEIVDSQDVVEHDDISGDDFIEKPVFDDPGDILERAQKAYELRTNRKLMIDGEKALIDDTDAFRYYLRHYVNKLWHDCFLNESLFTKKIQKQKPKGKFAKKILDVFLKEYQETKTLSVPREYNFREPTLMQKYFTVMTKHHDYYANFSGTGAGKTIASLLASRVNKSKITLIICPNGVVGQWKDVIDVVFPKSKIITKQRAFYAEESNNFQYLIINYDQFNQTFTKNNIKRLTKNKIDFVILDEIHFSKTSNEEHLSQRRKNVDVMLSLIRERHSKVKITGLSATPVVNNLTEGKSMIELLSGQNWDAELKTKLTYRNAMRLHEKFTIMSMREIPDYEIPNIDDSNVVAKIPDNFTLKNLNHDNLAIEQFCTEARLPEIIKKIKGKTIIYTELVNSAIPGKPGIVQMLQDGIENAGFSCSVHTGDNHSGHDAFVNDPNIQVLVASKTISTGVDDLQTVSHNLIFNNLPWTHALYTQVIGRLIRKGQKNKVTIHRVISDVEYDGKQFSFDSRRKNAIIFKKNILDCALTGEFPEKNLVNKNDAINALRDWIARLNEGKRLDLMRPFRIYDLEPEEIKKRERKFGDFSTLNRKLITSTSENNLKTIQNNVELWYAYHSALNENKKKWPFDPLDVWISKIEKLPKSRKIADLGCGEAAIGKKFGKQRVRSFDLHADDPKFVEECNIRSIPLRDDSVDFVIYNLSLMGTDWKEILKEGKRILKPSGIMFIADTKSHFDGYLKTIKNELEELNFNIYRYVEKEPFVMIEAINDF